MGQICSVLKYYKTTKQSLAASFWNVLRSVFLWTSKLITLFNGCDHWSSAVFCFCILCLISNMFILVFCFVFTFYLFVLLKQNLACLFVWNLFKVFFKFKKDNIDCGSEIDWKTLEHLQNWCNMLSVHGPRLQFWYHFLNHLKFPNWFQQKASRECRVHHNSLVKMLPEYAIK